MPYVQIPKELSRVKSKVVLNLTKRQLICFGSAAIVGIPAYIFTHGILGNDGAVLLMIGLMLPFFFMAMYERDGQPAEKVLIQIIRSRWFFPRTRPYKTENLYKIIAEEAQLIDKNTQKASAKSSAKTKK